MPTFVFTDPQGRKHEVTGPEGATEAQAFQILRRQLAERPAPAAPSEAPAADPKRTDAEAYAGGDLGGVSKQLLGGAKHAWDRAALGLKGLVTDLTPEDKALLAQGQAYVESTGPASTVGQVGADVAMGAAPVARMGGVLTRALSKLGAAAPLVADVAANAAYSAATAPEDRGSAAAWGAGGAAAGRAVNRVASGAVKPTSEAQRLLDRGVRLTPGQAGGGVMGEAANTYERALGAVPIVGRVVTGAKERALEDWNRSLLRGAEAAVHPNEAGRALLDVNPAAPVGRDALDELGTKFAATYNRMFPQGTTLQLDRQAAAVYDTVAQRLANKVAPSARPKFHEVTEWIGSHLKSGMDASQWKEAVEGELDAAIKTAQRDGHHSLAVALRELDKQLNEALPHFAGMPAAAAAKPQVDAGYRNFKVLEKAMSKAGPVKRGGVVYPADLATTAQASGHDRLVREAVDAQRVFGSAPNSLDKVMNAGRALAVGAGGHVVAGGLAVPAAALSLLGTTEMGRKFLLGQIPWQAFVARHPEVAAQVGRALAQPDSVQEPQ